MRVKHVICLPTDPVNANNKFKGVTLYGRGKIRNTTLFQLVIFKYMLKKIYYMPSFTTTDKLG